MSSIRGWCGNKAVPNWAVVTLALIALISLAGWLASPKTQHAVSQRYALEYLMRMNKNQSEARPEIDQVLKNCDQPCCSDPRARNPSVAIVCGERDSSESLAGILDIYCGEEVQAFGSCDELQQKKYFKICEFSKATIAHYFIYPCHGDPTALKPNCDDMPKCPNWASESAKHDVSAYQHQRLQSFLFNHIKIELLKVPYGTCLNINTKDFN